MDIARRVSPGRRLVPRIVAVATVAGLLACGAWGAYTLSIGYAPPLRIDRASVLTDVVHRGALVRSVSASGTFATRRVAIVAAPSDGVVDAVLVTTGTHVTAGTPIVRLVNPDLDADVADAQAQITAAQADLDSIRQQARTAKLEREEALRATQADVAEDEDEQRVEQSLHDKGLVGDLPFRESIVKRDEARDRERLQRAQIVSVTADGTAKIAAARARITDLQGLLARKIAQRNALLVRSAEAGTVVSVSAQLGARASAGGELVRVADERDLEARLAVAESDARAVLPGQSVVLTTAAGNARGTIARIDPAAVNGTVQVAVAMTRLPAGVRTDESVQGQIELERIPDTIWVTRPAGVADDTTATLYRLTGSDRAVRVRVVFGRGSADRIAVRSGLRPGQTVIISDMSVAGDHADVTLE